LGAGDEAAAGQAEIRPSSHALVVGIDQYQCETWQSLQYAKADASAMAELLGSRGFEVTALYDHEATRPAILEALEGLSARVRDGDRFVFFFAGHGNSRVYSGRKWGFVVPADCGLSSSFISMQELRDWAERLGRAHHQLFILDACFSGLFGRLRGVQAAFPPDRSHLQDLQSFPARQFMTAGTGDQQVLDAGEEGHSLFTGQLLKALEEGQADANGDGYVTFNELGAYLEAAAWDVGQTPTFGILPGHEGGGFVFPLEGLTLPKPSIKYAEQTAPPEAQTKKARAVADLPTPIAYDPVQLKSGKPAALPGDLGNVSVTFWNQGEIELATLIVSPGQGKVLRTPILAVGGTESFTHAGYRYEITILTIDWLGKSLSFTVNGPVSGGSQ